MKKILAIFGSMALVVSSSTSVIACNTLDNGLKKARAATKSLTEIFSYYGRAVVLNDQEGIDFDYTLNRYKTSKAADLLTNYKGQKSASFNSILDATFGKNKNYKGFLSEPQVETNLTMKNGFDPSEPKIRNISAMAGAALLIFGNGFNTRTSGTLTSILTSDIMKNIVDDSGYSKMKAILSNQNLLAISNIFDFSDMTFVKTQQDAIHYSLNQLILGIAEITNQSISIPGKGDLTTSTKFDNDRKGNDGTVVLTRVFDAIIQKNLKITEDTTTLVSGISKIVKSIMVILKHLEAFSDIISLPPSQITDSDHLFSKTQNNIEVLKNVRKSNFDINSSLNIQKIVKVFQGIFQNPESDSNGYNFEKFLAILFQVEKKANYSVTLTDAGPIATVSKRETAGFFPIINAIANAAANATKHLNEYAETGIKNVLPKIAKSIVVQSKFEITGLVKIILDVIKKGISDEINKIFDNAYLKLWSGDILSSVWGLVGLDFDDKSKQNFKNFQSIFSTPLTDILSSFNINSKIIDNTFEKKSFSRLIDTAASFLEVKKDNSLNNKYLFNLKKVYELCVSLSAEYTLFNSLDNSVNDETKIESLNPEPVTLIPAFLKLNSNKGWHAKNSNNGTKKLQATDLLGAPIGAENEFQSGSFYEKLEKLFQNDLANNDTTGDFLKKIVLGIKIQSNKLKDKSIMEEKNKYEPIVFSKNFKITNISDEAITDNNSSKVSFTLKYIKGKVITDYEFIFQNDSITSSLNNGTYWYLKGAQKISK
ncbi:hypothetical protein SSABA_v1c04680 [Spiroplasma sabaudiense Ar-1343]|uniref:MOLPALP family lipoprotein n=1 Tax=Spiroplasma sabaudiense Ar-1343 TaxID=1276257 RepID=W6AAJ8_9MOLU|nr:MOLPALP family lipoprotein [Spiroplasma sabaudiense]AHI53875.1 hypothetical protein SSABA_v1c04680 [Spiroplasma sabaudiense Ar-1343]